MQLAPSVLSANLARLEEEISLVHQAGADWIHLDVMDGRFVPSLTFGAPILKHLPKLPGVTYDAHLMVMEPLALVEDFAKAGCQRLTFHMESTHQACRTIEAIRKAGMSPGVALSPATDLSALLWVLDLVDMVLLMSVEPGFGGQKFMSGVLPKISQLKGLIQKRGLSTLVQVDGGIHAENIKQVVEAGADVCVAGTAVFGQKDYKQAMLQLYRACGESL